MGRPTTIIGDGNIKKLLMRPHAPQKHDKLVLYFFLTLPTTAKWRFGFALVLAYAPTLAVTHSNFFFLSNKD
jgi:hypothetical protein